MGVFTFFKLHRLYQIAQSVLFSAYEIFDWTSHSYGGCFYVKKVSHVHIYIAAQHIFFEMLLSPFTFLHLSLNFQSLSANLKRTYLLK